MPRCPKPSGPSYGPHWPHWIGAATACCLLLGLGATAASARAEGTAAGPAAATGILDNARARVRSGAEWLARSVDSWFGDEPFEQGGKVSDGRLDLRVLKREGQGADVDLRFNARFELPNARRNAYLFLGRDNPRQVAQDRPEQISAQQALLNARAADRAFQAGLGVALRDDIDFRIGVRSRLKPYVQARYERPVDIAPGHVLGLRQTVFWTYDDRLGSTTTLSYDWALTPRLALRWLNAATITEVSKNFEWSSTAGLYRQMGRQRLLSLELLVNGTGTQGTGKGLSDYGALVKWEQPIHQDWLLMELVAGHFWPRYEATSERGRAWALGAGLKLRF